MSGCDHHHTPTSEKALNWAIIANVGLTFVQVIGGILSGSLALVADAVHNLSDAAALIVAAIAIRIGKKPADERRTFGYKRAETIAALINFVVLVTIGVFLCIEAIDRFLHPNEIHGVTVSVIAGIALIIDVFTAYIVFKSAEKNMNMKAVILHNIADALGSLAVIISGVIIYHYGWVIIDPILTILIAIYIIAHGLHGLPEAVHLLMNGTPRGLDLEKVALMIENVDGVEAVHSMHVWQIDEKVTSLEAHVVLPDPTQISRVKKDIKDAIQKKFNIGHSTLEFELPGEECRDHEKIEHHVIEI